MSNYSDPITATGSLITFDAPSGGVFDSLSVPITPTQDLHGYDHPWPGGGGANKLPNLRNIGANRIALGQTETYTNLMIPLTAGTYTFSITHTSSVNWRVYTRHNSTNTVLGRLTPGGGTDSFTFTVAADTNYSFSVYDGNGVDSDDIIQFWLVSGSSAGTYTPYENICPISGLIGLSVYVSPTSQQAQATEYAVSFGSTVYAGFVDPITGEVKERPEYPSYNGEVLVGPWLSSMDEYAVGVTPTTGAQVVDLGGALATSSITPADISMRTGSNNVWVDTSAVITLIYRLLIVDRQTGATSIGKQAESLLVSKQFGSYSKVVINVTAELYYESGNDTGRTLTISCPWGTQAMADNILASLEGYQYQPYEAQNALLDPAAELGDGLTVNGVYGGIFKQTLRSGVLHSSDVSAPQDEEIDHEYKFTPAAERKIERRINNMESELSVQADQISAKVDRQGGDPSSVSWTMDSDVFKVQADGNDVLTIDENGLTVNGDGTFTGSVQAKNIRYGGSSGTFSGGGISGGSIGTSKFNSGINVSLGNADYSADVFSGAVVASWTKVQSLQVVGTFFLVGTMNKGGTKYDTVTKTVKDGSGNNITIHYLGY